MSGAEVAPARWNIYPLPDTRRPLPMMSTALESTCPVKNPPVPSPAAAAAAGGVGSCSGAGKEKRTGTGASGPGAGDRSSALGWCGPPIRRVLAGGGHESGDMSDGGTHHRHHPGNRLCNRLLLLLVFCCAQFPGHGFVGGTSLRKDQEVLVQLKRYLVEANRFQRGAYAQWNDSDPSPCNWTGITCENGRVTRVDLRDSGISGAVFPGFSDLAELTHLDLSKNTISGALPPSLNRCAKLRHLNLSHNIIDGGLDLSGLHQLRVVDVTLNRFAGEIQPDFAGICANLVTFNVSLNKFSGTIRNLFDGCPNLRHLDLSANNFAGDVWPGFSSLEEFSVSENNITGTITPEFFPPGCRLRVLDLSQNSLRGELPDSIANCGNISTVNLWGNGFRGRVPSGIGSLPELENLFLGNNSFDPRIPEQLRNCSKLAFLDLSKNSFGGNVQKVFGSFTQVKFLVLHGNNYTGGIESSGILRLPQIQRLDLSYNKFSGPLPVEIAGMPKLKFLILAYNNFSGNVPPEFGTMSGLQALDLSYNNLSGVIPPSVGNLTSLLWLMLANNSFSGEIPPEIGNCRSLLWLNLANNRLSGRIPPSITGMGSAPNATFEVNRREGRAIAGSGECLAMKRWIPADYPPFSFVYTILTRKSCRSIWDHLLDGHGIFPVCRSHPSSRRAISGYIQLTGNLLVGEIPPEIGKMTWLSLIHLNRNKFSGRLPPEIGRLPLVVLNVSNNLLSGPIPSQIGDIKCLQNLDLSHNNFSGEIPLALNHLSELSKFNVSFNPLLRCKIPSMGQLSTFGEDSFLGNPFITPLWKNSSPPPPAGWKGAGRKNSSRIVAFWSLVAISVAFFTAGFLTLVFCSRRRKEGAAAAPDDLFLFQAGSSKHSYDDETAASALASASLDAVKVFRLDKNVAFTYPDIVASTGGFSEEMVVGRGGCGVVYRGLLPDGRQVAVKRLQRQGPEGEREFRAEMEVLCGSGGGAAAGWPHPNLVALFGWCLLRAEKLLVYEYMEGGSLEEVISDWGRLGWAARVEVAAGVARALAFLHHECLPAVVHRDVKASNVLLDGEGRARVTDFGLARMVCPGDSHVTTVVAGTVGYVAPEYGHTWQATTKGDVYSFGVLAMELATGRRAVDGGDECLVEWARRVSGEGRKGSGAAAVVPLPEPEEAPAPAGEGAWAMCELLRVGMRCTAEAPQARPNMKEVAAMLLRIRTGVVEFSGELVCGPPPGTGR